MLSRDDCVLKTSGNFKITSLVARFSSANHLISPLGIAPLLENLIIITVLWEGVYAAQQYTIYTTLSIFSPIDPGHFTAHFSQLTSAPSMFCFPGLLLSLWGSAGSWPRQPRPDLRQTGGRGPRYCWLWQWWDGITRLNNVRIMGPETETLNGITANHTTVKLLGFLHFQSPSPTRPPTL